MKEVLIFAITGNERLIKQMEKKYPDHTINVYYNKCNDYILSVFNVKKMPTAIVLENNEEIERY